MESWPFSVVGSPTIKSILMSSYFQLGIDSGWSSPTGFKWMVVTRQQLSHLATNAAISFFIFVHQKHVFWSWYILLLPGWMDKLEECASSRIWFLNSLSFGTTSRSLNHNTPLSSSQKMIGFFLFHLSFDMEYVLIGFLELNDFRLKRATNSDIV